MGVETKSEFEGKVVFVKSELPVFIYNIDENDNSIKASRQAMVEEVSNKPRSNHRTNIKSYYSTSYIVHKENFKFTFIVDKVTKLCKDVIKNFFCIEQFHINCSNCWGSVYKEKDYAVEHMHFPSALSAVVYLDVEKDASGIFFNETEMKVSPGLVLIFPGILQHHVPKTKGNRIIVAMNFEVLL